MDTPIASFSQCVRDLAYVLATGGPATMQRSELAKTKSSNTRESCSTGQMSAHLNHPQAKARRMSGISVDEQTRDRLVQGNAAHGLAQQLGHTQLANLGAGHGFGGQRDRIRHHQLINLRIVDALNRRPR